MTEKDPHSQFNLDYPGVQVARVISDPVQMLGRGLLQNLGSLTDAVDQAGVTIEPPAPQVEGRPVAGVEFVCGPHDGNPFEGRVPQVVVPDHSILTQAPLLDRKRTLTDMSKSMDLELVVGLHPGLPVMAARDDVVMHPKRLDGPPREDCIRQVMSPRSATTLPSGSGMSSSSSQPVAGETSAKRLRENHEKLDEKTYFGNQRKDQESDEE